MAKGNCLVVRQSVLEKILPSRKDVPLLAHAREVDIHDTELMMGDDDGFLAVVISNRPPRRRASTPTAKPTPVKYLACLINLEGQFHRLIPEAPPHARSSSCSTRVHSSVVYAGRLRPRRQRRPRGALGRRPAWRPPVSVHVAAPHADGPHADGPHAGRRPLAGTCGRTQPSSSRSGPAMQAYTAKAG